MLTEMHYLFFLIVGQPHVDMCKFCTASFKKHSYHTSTQTYDVTIWRSVNNQLLQNDDQFKKNSSFTTLVILRKYQPFTVKYDAHKLADIYKTSRLTYIPGVRMYPSSISMTGKHCRGNVKRTEMIRVVSTRNESGVCWVMANTSSWGTSVPYRR